MILLIEQRLLFMDEEIKKYLYDIKESVDSIEEYLGGIKDFNTYKSKKMLR